MAGREESKRGAKDWRKRRPQYAFHMPRAVKRKLDRIAREMRLSRAQVLIQAIEKMAEGAA